MNPSRLKNILGYGLIGLALIALPFGEFKPNRVLKGVLLYPINLFGLWLTLLLIFTVFVLFFIELKIKKNKSWIRLFTFIGLTLLPNLTLIALSNVSIQGLDYNPLIARISLGLGFYVLTTGVLVLLSQIKAYKWVLFLMIILIALSAGFNLIPNLGLVKEFNNVQDRLALAISSHLIFSLSSA